MKEKEEKEKFKQQIKKRKIEESSDSANSEELSFAETSDEEETFSDIQNSEIEEFVADQATPPVPNPVLENYYAVYYQEQFYIGRVLKIEKKVFLKFVSEVAENHFVWPKHQDDDWVEKERLFYGPIQIFGNEPFHVDNIVLKKIKLAYRQYKSNTKNI